LNPRRFMERLRYIVVEGAIGVGKTTLTRILAERFKARGVLEVVEENPFLADFYGDRQRYAFQTQLFFLLSRFKQQQELFQPDLFNQVTISDYLFAKDRIFASLNLDAAEMALYDRVWELLSPRVLKPDLVIFLQARLEVLLARIKKRGRAFEKQFDAEYLQSLVEAYNGFFFTYSETPLLVVNTSDIDIVENDADVDDLLRVVHDMKGGVRHYQPMGTRAG
jgi:deoxyadenosine/deoxycytidine kinase